MAKKAVILLSGGIDSATCLAIAKNEGCLLYCLTFDYEQRHIWEINCARKIAAAVGVAEHTVLTIDLGKLGGSALTDEIDVPKARGWQEIQKGIPVTYVPARNTIFLAYAMAWAEVRDASEIFIGVNAIDYSGYPDCRPEFIQAFENMANVALKKTVEDDFRITLRTPLISMTKGEIIKRGHELNFDYSLTHSCYDPTYSGKPCQSCDSCLLRKKGFSEAGLADPLIHP